MHAPDGFLGLGTAVATGAISFGVVGASLRMARTRLADRQIPLTGVSAAFIFAAQLVNFPVAAGTTGHLLGGALAAILLGPTVGALVVTVVVVVQALVFADGGLSALGYNTLNMAIVTSFGGYAAFVAVRKILPRNASGVATAAGLAAGISVVLASMALSIEWLFGATAPVSFDTVFAAMVGVHLLIGVGEGVITGLLVASVLAARPDLVYGARHLDPAALRGRASLSTRGLVIAALAVTLVVGTIVSQFAGSDPDGLERVAEDLELTADQAGDARGPFADYAVDGLDNEQLSLAIAAGAGIVIVGAIGYGLVATRREPSAV